jgi:glycine cleavage system H protein
MCQNAQSPQEVIVQTGEFYELQFDKFRLRVPKGYWYAGYDTWVRLDGNEAIIGVTDFFQTKLGDIVDVTPVEQDSFEQDDVFATLESIKAAVDLTIPASGTVVQFNHALDSHPELIEQDPFGHGWIVRLHLTDWEGDRAMLLSAEAYFQLMQEKVDKELERA